MDAFYAKLHYSDFRISFFPVILSPPFLVARSVISKVSCIVCYVRKH